MDHFHHQQRRAQCSFQLSGPGLGHLVERVLVLHSSGPASPISIMIVIRCTTRGLQQTFRAIAPALQASTYSSSSTWVAAGEGGKGGGWGGGAWGKWGIRWRPRRCCDSRKVKSWLGWICSAHCIPGWSKDWRRGHICRRLWGEERDPFNRGHINYTEYSLLLLFVCWLPLRELLVKSFFTEQCVNTGGANLLYYPFSQRAITPTTLLPKTRLTSVSIKSFTPWIKPSLCVCVCVCLSMSAWVCAAFEETEDFFVTTRVARSRSLGLHAKLLRYNRPLTLLYRRAFIPCQESGGQKVGVGLLNPVLFTSVFTSLQFSNSLPLLVHCSVSSYITYIRSVE